MEAAVEECALAARAEEYDDCCDVLRRAVARDSGNTSLWLVLCHALMTAERSAEAMCALQQYTAKKPMCLQGLFLATKLHLNALGDYEAAVTFASKAYAIAQQEQPKYELYSRHLLGIASVMHAHAAESYNKRQELQEQALGHLHAVAEACPDDAAILFQLAALEADIRDIDAALFHVKQALLLDHHDVRYWQLLALLTSATKSFQTAAKICNAGIASCGKQSLLLFTKAHILLQMLKTEEEGIPSRSVAKDVVELLFALMKETGLADLFVLTEHEEVSIPVVVPADSGTEPRSPVHHDVLSSDLDLLFTLVDVYQTYHVCVASSPFLLQTASSILELCRTELDPPVLAQTYCDLGSIALLGGDAVTALDHLSTALAHNPLHIPALLKMGSLRLHRGDVIMAREYIRTALQVDAVNHEAWALFAETFTARGNYAAAQEPILTAMELECTAPALSFAHVARLL